ncbi:MAG: hypothetical protein V3V33_12585 [Candidatus Lokiarchaeia archaeon]
MVEVINMPDSQYYRCLKCLELRFASELVYIDGLGYLCEFCIAEE